MKTIEYFYSAHSAYAYLGAWRLAGVATEAGARVVHRPFDFLPVLRAAGAPPFDARSQAHIDHFFGRELVRWAEYRGLPILRHRPTHHDNPLALANGLIIAAQDAGADACALSRAILQAHWRDDADIADAGTLLPLAHVTCGDADALLRAATSGAVQARHAANTDKAIALNVFGSPTYIVDGDMFYGQDRLDLVARALARPFAP
ncbi:2-hydroxychromene-2-carboxylate isomerase [Sulfitobacter sabulilitoris]|uniref:2-hydroxychromene-2-carboxylate isomerase n=1 Tax=Sulfitobacter sabulilitoris TaxID=2562655 RepID=A0A5S3PLM5_9RHOB|nr:2-hydroxychromene-2-carboxylate isomerase [Sulfitobacter sabulilitoris]TMM55277.1 2-hydroxychromene-2-carboxylate isomerase [Sulfitobacter sabulilitoris]